ncbi:MAG: hypothetical protein WCY92_01220 [Novosphingobium sp.]|nr:hypothetical protein [Sphingobium yanoikuyae]
MQSRAAVSLAMPGRNGGGSAARLDIDMGYRRITEQAVDMLDDLWPGIAQRWGMREVRAYVEDTG